MNILLQILNFIDTPIFVTSVCVVGIVVCMQLRLKPIPKKETGKTEYTASFDINKWISCSQDALSV